MPGSGGKRFSCLTHNLKALTASTAGEGFFIKAWILMDFMCSLEKGMLQRLKKQTCLSLQTDVFSICCKLFYIQIKEGEENVNTAVK